MDEHVYIKKEPKWCGEEWEAPLPSDDNEAQVNAAGCGELRGVVQISQSSYSAAVNLAHGATRVKEERQVAVSPVTGVDFDGNEPQFVGAPDVLSSPACGTFVFCPVIGTPFNDTTTDCKQEPGESGGNKTTTDQTLVFVDNSSEVQGDATKYEASSQFSSQAGSSHVNQATDRDEHTHNTCGEKFRSCSELVQRVWLHGSGNKHKYVQFDVGRAKRHGSFHCIKIQGTKELSPVSQDDKPSTPSSVLSIPKSVQSVANSDKNQANVCLNSSRNKQIVNAGQTPYMCNAKWTKSSRRIRRKRIHTRDMSFACDVCGARFTAQSNLIRHLRSHTGQKPFACDKCEARYTTKENLVVHIRSHTGQKPFTCDKCEARYTTKENLVVHIRSHTGEKPFACDKCEARYTTKEGLVIHVISHTGQKPFACDKCEARYTTRTSLNRHIISHTGEKPFACGKCEAKYITKESLVIHIRSHTGEKPFACDKCEARYSTRSSLNRHLRSHSGKKQFACNA